MGAWFAFLLGCKALARWVLSQRQSSHVRRHRDHVPEAFAEVLNLAAHHRAADYTSYKQSAERREALLDVAVVLLWTLGGGLHAAETLSYAVMGERALDTTFGVVAQGCVLLLVYAAAEWMLGLPLTLWRTFGIEQRFGFNRTTWRMFCLDQIKGTLLGLVLGLPLFCAVVALLHRRSASGWVWAWAVYALTTLVLVWAAPRIIAPLFNTFRPLTDPTAKARIDGLLQRCGYGHGGLYVMDGSARSSHGNAYFTGLGRSKRIVFFDTLLATLTLDEVEGVLAHELGHFALGHIVRQLVVGLATSFVAFYVAAQLLSYEALYGALGVPQASLTGRLLVLGMVASTVAFWVTPWTCWISRQREYAADAYAARWASGDALGRALIKLFVDNGATLTSDPWYTAFYSSHPPALARLAALKDPPAPQAATPL